MLQNNFPVQEQFMRHYGDEFLAMQAYFTTGSGTKLEKLQEHSKLFFAFSSFLRSGIEE